MLNEIPGVGVALGGLLQAQQLLGRKKLRKRSKGMSVSKKEAEANTSVVFVAREGRVCKTSDCGTVLSISNPEPYCRRCQSVRSAQSFRKQVLAAAKAAPAQILPFEARKFALSMGVTSSGRKPKL